MTRLAKTNKLVMDARRQAAKAKAVLAAVGRIGEQVDSLWLAESMNGLSDAVSCLEAAANQFERHGMDYPSQVGV